jgi:putative ABC transport system ATP-binding protein
MSFLHIKQVSFAPSTHERPILSNISYQVNQGDFIVILGSNGSGKSSLLKCLDRRYQTTAGQIYLKNRPFQSFSTKEFSEQVITLTQNCQESLFPTLTLFENYLLAKERFPNGNLPNDKLFFAQYLSSFNPNLPHKLDQLVALLSGGEKQALALALSVLHPPELLLLDEHTSALDPKSAEHLMKLTYETVKKNNITCLLTTHDLKIALEYGNRILVLRQGSIQQMIDEETKKSLDLTSLLAVYG